MSQNDYQSRRFQDSSASDFQDLQSLNFRAKISLEGLVSRQFKNQKYLLIQ